MNHKNLDRYGNPPIPWSRALEQLESHAGSPTLTYWLATTRPDGRPHVAGVGALWVDGKLYITSGAATRKSRNLSSNASCCISVSLPGIDLVIEGQAARVTDDATLRRPAERYAAQGWPATAENGALTARTARPALAHRHGSCMPSPRWQRSPSLQPSPSARHAGVSIDSTPWSRRCPRQHQTE